MRTRMRGDATWTRQTCASEERACTEDHAYQRPRLHPLGRWNVFTRQQSIGTVDDPVGSGFFEFNLLGD